MPQTRNGAVSEVDFRNVEPHQQQRRVLQSVETYDVTVLSPGRQSGKSSTRPFWDVDQIARVPGFATLAYMGPAHADAKKAFDEDLVNLGNAGMVKDHGGDDQDRHIDFHAILFEQQPDHLEFEQKMGRACECWNCHEARSIAKCLNGEKNTGGRVYYAAGSPDAHRGFQRHKLHGAFLDEYSHIAPDAWIETIQPMFNTTGGHALVVGTPIPDGINFSGFSDLFDMGDPAKLDRDPCYNSIRWRSEDNPYANIAYIARQRAYLVKVGRTALMRCLYDGEFVTDFGAVFTNLGAVFSLPAKIHAEDHWLLRSQAQDEDVSIGVDLGKHEDPTIISVFSKKTLEQLELVRLRKVEYFDQLPRICAVINRYRVPDVWCEGREGGEMVTEFLKRRYGAWLRVVKWSSGGQFDKSGAVVRGMDLCQQTGIEGMRGWRMMNVDFQRDEFTKFARTKTPKGNTQYAAPAGRHDDTVAAALYASYSLNMEWASDPVVPVDRRVYDLSATPPGSEAWMELLIESQRVPTGGGTYTLF